jgi:hypothetical protein
MNPLRGPSSSKTNARTVATVNGTKNIASNSLRRVDGFASLFAEVDKSQPAFATSSVYDRIAFALRSC